jgi:hypothetical protein
MKWPVYILLMAALTYLGETIQLPSYLLHQQQAAAATCKMEKGQQCPYEHSAKAATHDGKSSAHDSKGCCDPTANCSNCPLCYTAELTSTYTSARFSTSIRQHYPEIPGQPLTDYAASSWKPPDA